MPRNKARPLGLLLLQLVAAVLSWSLVAPALHPVLWALAAGLLAGMLALLCWRKPVLALAHGLVLPVALLFGLAGLPAWGYLLALLLTWLFWRNVLTEQVPLYRSCHAVADLLQAELAPGARFLEAGAGDARLALALARRRPDVVLTALENAWGSYCLARLRWFFAGRPANLQIALQNFWQVDWAAYDTVYVFLSPVPMGKVWDKFQRQSPPGATLISNTFCVPGVVPARQAVLPGRLQQALLFWQAGHGTE